jgi:hypothetical protein
MTEEQFRECYMFCLEQGWVHNTPIQDLVNDYFIAPKGRNVLFRNHLKKIVDGPSHEIHVLIGEAPPYYPNCEFPKHRNRKYFYDENQSMNTAYFKEPCKHFLGITEWRKIKETKSQLLQSLALDGVLIFDIFPFPVYQSTDIRDKIARGKTQNDENDISSYYHDMRSSFFTNYLNYFFLPRFVKLLEEFESKKIKIYLFAPKYTSIQFIHWAKDLELFKKHFVQFSESEFEYLEKIGERDFLNSSLIDFVKKLEPETTDEFIEILKEYPIFMNGSGNPDFQNFVNGKKI